MSSECWVPDIAPTSGWESCPPIISDRSGVLCTINVSYVDIAVCDCAICNYPITDANWLDTDYGSGPGCVEGLGYATDEGFDIGYQ